MVNNILWFVFVYFDGILIFSSSLQEHVHHVQQVLQCLLGNQLYVKAEHCKFHQSTVQFLGFVVSRGQMEIYPEKSKAVVDWPLPVLSVGSPVANAHKACCKPPSIPCRPWSHVAMDFVTCLPVLTVILTIVDRFLKFVHFVALPKLPSSKKMAEFLFINVFCHHSLPLDATSDRGPQFSNRSWKAFCSLIGAKAHSSNFVGLLTSLCWVLCLLHWPITCCLRYQPPLSPEESTELGEGLEPLYFVTAVGAPLLIALWDRRFGCLPGISSVTMAAASFPHD